MPALAAPLNRERCLRDLTGGLARLLGTACRTPFDILRQRLQVQGSLLRSQYKVVVVAVVVCAPHRRSVNTCMYICPIVGLRDFRSVAAAHQNGGHTGTLGR
jgi:hypothetical protein